MVPSIVKLSVATVLLAACLFLLVAASPSIPGSGGAASVVRPVLITVADATQPPGFCLAYEDGKRKVVQLRRGPALYECKHSFWYGWDWYFIRYV